MIQIDDEIIDSNSGESFLGNPDNERQPFAGYYSANTEDFTFLYKQLFPVIYSTAIRFVERDNATDLVADVFTRFWKIKRHFDGQLSVKRYLQTAIKNACINFLISKNYRQERIDELKREAANHEFIDETMGEVLKKIHAAVEMLPKQQRTIFKMALLDGLKNKEIAEALNLSVNTIRAQKQNALRFLRLHINTDDFLLMLIAFMGAVLFE